MCKVERPICGETSELGAMQLVGRSAGNQGRPEGPGPRARLPILRNGPWLAPLSSHFLRALKIELFRLSRTFGEAGLLHKLAFITCLSLPCFVASPGTFGTEALFKRSPVCTRWGLWSRVASLAPLKGQRLHHCWPQAQRTFYKTPAPTVVSFASLSTPKGDPQL